MAVVPTGILSLPLLGIVGLLEGSATFQSWAALTGRTHLEKIDDPGSVTSPYAIVGFADDGLELTGISGGASWHYGVGGAVAFMFVADVDPNNSEVDELITFANNVGAIIAEMADASGGAAGAFAFDSLTMPYAPRLSNPDDHQDDVPFISAVFVVGYGRGPTQ